MTSEPPQLLLVPPIYLVMLLQLKPVSQIHKLSGGEGRGREGRGGEERGGEGKRGEGKRGEGRGREGRGREERRGKGNEHD